MARPLRTDPAQVPTGAAVHEDLAQGLPRLRHDSHLLRISAGQGLGVLASPDSDRGVDVLQLVPGKGVYPGELLRFGHPVEDLGDAVDLDLGHRMRTARQRLAKTRSYERGGDGIAVDHDGVILLELDGVSGEQLGELVNAGIGHGCGPFCGVATGYSDLPSMSPCRRAEVSER
jgi:hypothetical protein